MKTLKTYFGGLLWLACLALTGIPGLAADFSTIQLNRALGIQGTQYTYTNACPAMRLKWIGSAAIGSATVASASGNLTFLNAAGAADVTVVASTGIVDAATYSTFGKMAAKINGGASGTGSNWACTLIGVRPSQLTASTALTAFSATATNATNADGMILYYTTGVLKMVSAVVGPEWMPNAMLTVSNDDLLNRRSTAIGSPTGSSWQNELWYVTGTLTYSASTASLYVYAVKDDTDGATELLLWQDAGAATGVAKTIPVLPPQAPIKAPPGWRIIVQYIGASGTTVTAGTMQVNGLTYKSGS